MKKYFLLLYFVLLMSLFGCNSQSNIKTEFLISSGLYTTDSIVKKVKIKGENYEIYFLRDKYDVNLNEYSQGSVGSPLSIVINKEGNQQPLYLKKFYFDIQDDNIHRAGNETTEYTYSLFKLNESNLNADSKLFLQLERFYGGAGSIKLWYYITFREGNICIDHLFDTDRLGQILFKDENEILELSGIMGYESSVLDDIKYKINLFKYNAEKDYFSETKFEETKLKYPSLLAEKQISDSIIETINPEEIVKLIQSKEPLLFKQSE